MSMSDTCDNCKKNINWDEFVWNISEIKGYRIKNAICSCGHETFRAVPITDEKIKLWNTIPKIIK